MKRFNLSFLQLGDVLLVHADGSTGFDDRAIATATVVTPGDRPWMSWPKPSEGPDATQRVQLAGTMHGTVAGKVDDAFTPHMLIVRGGDVSDSLMAVYVDDVGHTEWGEVVAVRCFEVWRDGEVVESHVSDNCGIGQHDQ